MKRVRETHQRELTISDSRFELRPFYEVSDVLKRAPRLAGDLIDEDSVVAPGTIQSLEGNRMRPGGDVEYGGGQTLVRSSGGGEGADHDAVNQHPEVLSAAPIVAALGGVEGQDVRAGRPVADGLAERAGLLEEGDLRTVGGRRVARGEAAIVSRDAGGAREGPGGAGRAVLELPAPTNTCSKPWSATAAVSWPTRRRR